MQPVKGCQSRVLDTLFGPVHLDSPHWQVCRCRCAWDHPPVFRRWYPRFQVPVGREATPA
jgi:hypothetical protein